MTKVAGRVINLHFVIFTIAWVLGYLPVIDTWNEANPIDFKFRLLILPLLIGLMVWLFFNLVLIGLNRIRGGLQVSAQQARVELVNWLRIIADRWIYFLITGLLAATTFWQYNSFFNATNNLQNYYESLRQESQRGYSATRHSHANWCSKALSYNVVPAIDFSSQSNPEYRDSNYGMRYLGMFYLKERKNLKFELSSDDGSILLIDGLRRINLLGRHPVITKKEMIKLEPGWHCLELLYFQEGDGARIALQTPPEVASSIRPLSSEAMPRDLWIMNRTIETTYNRYNILFWAAGILLIILLLPYPKFSSLWLKEWIKSNWLLLIGMTLASVLLLFRLDVFPGLNHDESMVGDSAFSQHWYGIANRDISAWAWSDFAAKVVLLAQRVFLLGVFTLRLFPAIFNLIGLFMCVLGLRMLVNQRTAVIAVFLIGTAPWFASFSRVAYEMLMISYFVFGGSILTLALIRKTYWAGILLGALMGFGFLVHIWWLHVIAGMGFAAFLIMRFRLFLSKAFWLATITFVTVSHDLLYTLLFKGMHNPTGGIDIIRAFRIAITSIEGIPSILSGEMILHQLNAVLLMPVLPVVPLVILSLVLSWPFTDSGSRHRTVLIWCGLTTCGSILGQSLIIPVIKTHYFVVIAGIMCIWTATFIDNMWEKGLRKVAITASMIITIYGLAVFLINGPFNYNPKITTAFQIDLDDPSEAFWVTSQEYFHRRELYEHLVELGYPAYIPNLRINGPLWFLERSDTVGRHGYLMSKPKKGAIVVLFNELDQYHRWGNTFRQRLESAGSEVRTPIPLPAHLADKYKAYLLNKDFR